MFDVPGKIWLGGIRRFAFGGMRPIAFILALTTAAAIAAPAQAALQIDINKGNTEPLPIAITDFLGAPGQEASAGTDIAGRFEQKIVALRLFDRYFVDTEFRTADRTIIAEL